MSSVVLFRDPDRGQSYARALEGDHGLVASIPVLEHQDVLSGAEIGRLLMQQQQQQQQQAAGEDGQRRYSALVFTSQTAVAAVGRAADEWVGGASERAAQWRRFLAVPVFAVGRATGDACRAHLFRHAPGADIRGEECGQAALLLPRVVEFCQALTTTANAAAAPARHRAPRLAFFCGSQRRDTLPQGIAASGAAVLDEIVAYTTAARCPRRVQDELARAVAARAPDCSAPLWMVLFSPSGARVVVPALRQLVDRGLLPAYRIAAIGRTTAAEILALGIDPQSVVLADEPSEQGVRRALAPARSKQDPV